MKTEKVFEKAAYAADKEYLDNLDGINTNELSQLVELIEKRTY